jgi:hypothetical protein
LDTVTDHPTPCIVAIFVDFGIEAFDQRLDNRRAGSWAARPGGVPCPGR